MSQNKNRQRQASQQPKQEMIKTEAESKPEANTLHGTDPVGVVVPAGDLDSRIEWVSDGEDHEERRKRADAIYAHESDSDPDFDAHKDELGARLKDAVYQDSDESDGDEGDGEVTGEDVQSAEDVSEPEVSEPETGQSDTDYEATHGVAKPDGVIIPAGQEVKFEAKEISDNLVAVTKDVYREVYPFRSKRPTYILVYRAGTVLPKSSVQKS